MSLKRISSPSTPRVISMDGHSQSQRELARPIEEDGRVPEYGRFLFGDVMTAVNVPASGADGKLPQQEGSEDQGTLEMLRNDMVPLEILEIMLADQYEMGKDFDSVEVLCEARVRAVDDEVSQSNLRKLVELQSLRFKLSAIEQESPHSNQWRSPASKYF
ncbi:hypothetical protein EDD18DRAFT_1219438 [Armillaria luteobubalina]|uniref:Uncharacterized protein n=1 Tax=Armillaria luteobubalina TaxID=153913 RepID=A0AA39NZX9_9AGAR|nr:hypothetical protein EDD18DRAFT_1219438 [Armillaria luteobubalina]